MIITLFTITFLIPYAVIGTSAAWGLVIAATSTLLIIKKKIKLRKNQTATLFLFLNLYLCVHLLLINFYTMATGINYSWNGGFDFIIYLTYAALTAVTLVDEGKVSPKLFTFFLILITTALFYSSFIAYLGSPAALNFAMLYSTGDVYNKGYAQFRAFGIIGQPGKLGFFSAMLSLYIFVAGIKTKNVLYFLLAGLVIASGAVSFSRIAFVCWIITLLSLLIIERNFKILASVLMLLLCSSYYVIQDHYDTIVFLLRGINIEDLKLATLNHRFVLKAWALDILSKDFVTVMFGIGSPKEYLGTFANNYASDLTLRHPDSSQTVILIRFGLIGTIIFYTVAIYTIILNIKLEKYLTATFIFSFVFFSLLDPTFHDLKSYTLFLLIIKYKVEDFKIDCIRKRRAIY